MRGRAKGAKRARGRGGRGRAGQGVVEVGVACGVCLRAMAPTPSNYRLRKLGSWELGVGRLGAGELGAGGRHHTSYLLDALSLEA